MNRQSLCMLSALAASPFLSGVLLPIEPFPASLSVPTMTGGSRPWPPDRRGLLRGRHVPTGRHSGPDEERGVLQQRLRMFQDVLGVRPPPRDVGGSFAALRLLGKTVGMSGRKQPFHDGPIYTRSRSPAMHSQNRLRRDFRSRSVSRPLLCGNEVLSWAPSMCVGCPAMPNTILDDIKLTVAEYYDSERTISFYRDFWDPEHYHFGYYQFGISPLDLRAMTDNMARRVIGDLGIGSRIPADARILDLGCGIGGTARLLAGLYPGVPGHRRHDLQPPGRDCARPDDGRRPIRPRHVRGRRLYRPADAARVGGWGVLNRECLSCAPPPTRPTS